MPKAVFKVDEGANKIFTLNGLWDESSNDVFKG
jgi:hypothetical protein